MEDERLSKANADAAKRMLLILVSVWVALAVAGLVWVTA